MSENYNHNRMNRSNLYMCENWTMQMYLLRINVWKFSSVKISTFIDMMKNMQTSLDYGEYVNV